MVNCEFNKYLKFRPTEKLHQPWRITKIFCEMGTILGEKCFDRWICVSWMKFDKTCYILLVFLHLSSFILIGVHYLWWKMVFLGWLSDFIIIIIIVIKKGRQCKAERESDIHPISPKTPAQQYQPIDRKNKTGKRVEDYSKDRAA